MVSENTIKAIDYMKAHIGEEIDKEGMAEEIGVSVRSIGGILLSLSKKDIFTTVNRVVTTEKGESIVKKIVPSPSIATFEFTETAPVKKAAVSEKTLEVAKYLSGKVGSSEKFTTADVAAALDKPKTSIDPIVTGLAKKGLVERGEPVGVIIDEKAVMVKYLTVKPEIIDFIREAEAANN